MFLKCCAHVLYLLLFFVDFKYEFCYIYRLDEELENPIPLQLEASPLSRDILCTFPAVGTVLRMTADRGNEKMGLHLLKAGTWVQFKNITFEVRFGLWCGILLPKTRLSYLPNDDDLVMNCKRFSMLPPLNISCKAFGLKLGLHILSSNTGHMMNG